MAPQARDRAAAVDDAPRHRAAALLVGVGVLVGRAHQRGIAARGLVPVGIEARTALLDVPAEVLAGRGGGGLHVDLLPRALPHVADVEVSSLRVEGEAVRVAEALGPAFGRRGLGLGPVEAQELAEVGGVVLARFEGITAAAAVTEAQVEEVAADRDGAAVVVAVGLVELVPDLLAVAVGLVRRGRIALHQEARDAALEVPRRGRARVVDGPVDPEAPVAGVVGRERQPQQAALAGGADAVPRLAVPGQVEERVGEQHAVLHDAHAPRQLEHEQAVVARNRRGGHEHRRLEARDHAHGREALRVRRRCAQQGPQDGQCGGPRRVHVSPLRMPPRGAGCARSRTASLAGGLRSASPHCARPPG